MSTFDNPFDPDAPADPLGLRLRPASQPGRARPRRRSGSCNARAVESEEQALRRRRRLGGDARGVPAGRRAPRVPEVGRRLDRAGGDLAVLPAQDRDRGVRAGRRDREEGPQGRLHPDHLRHADHHGAPDGLLQQARPQRRGDQDRRLGGDPRQDAQQGIRRRAHALADAARDHARRRLERRSPTPCRRSRTSTARRSRWRSSTRTSAIRSRGRASSSRCRSTIRCTTTCCATTWPSTASIPTQDIQIRAVPPPEMVANLRADNIDGFLGARSGQPARGLRRRRLHPHAVEGDLGRPSRAARSRRRKEFVTDDAEHLRGAAEGDHRRHRVRAPSRRTASRSPRRSRRRTTSTSR